MNLVEVFFTWIPYEFTVYHYSTSKRRESSRRKKENLKVSHFSIRTAMQVAAEKESFGSL